MEDALVTIARNAVAGARLPQTSVPAK